MFKNKPARKLMMSERTGVIMAVFFILGGLAIGRLFYLQIIRHSGYREESLGQHQLDREILQSRGEIFMHDYKNNELVPLVINRDMGLLFIVPKEIIDKEKTANDLAEVLESDEVKREELKADILTKAGKPGDPYEPIRHKVEPETMDKIKNLKLPGVYFESELVRYYPEKESAGQLTGFLGFTGEEQVGQYGIEGYFEKDLAGERGRILADKDVAGRLITATEKELKEAEDGADIILTIDRVVQGKAYEFIKEATETSEAQSGVMIVMEPKTGRIQALAGYPSFDPNNYGQVEDIKNYRNLAVSEAYEPGSIFKVITMSAGLDSGAVQAGDTFTDTGETRIGPDIIRNADNKKYGQVSMTGILENSINNGTVFIAQKTGRETFKEYVENFGFGRLTGIELTGEATGNISSLSEKREIYLATASFGQGLTVTPIQMAAALSTIVNNGRLVKPRIVDYLKKDEKQLEEAEDKNGEQIISGQNAEIVKAMMVSVVKNGHAKRAQVVGYNIGGKTGTAQIAEPGAAGYSESTNHSFIAFGPLEDPRFVIVVKLLKPQRQWAESTAVPPTANMIKFLLQYYQIPPEN
ncbi:penicillin-binding protein 2 [Candidatus Kuenenbacteria bacterium]|nr:penicillin-binding protein 2 [Candidatus Kuenenbacteria bacterium]